MKNILLLILIVFRTNIKSQITFEQAYDSAATYNLCAGNISRLLMVNFETLGQHYVKVNECGKNMKIYNLNHALVKTISLTNLPTNGGVIGDILYISQKLFNNDTKIEFLYCLTSPTFSTMVYDEDGVVLFSEPGAPLVLPHIHMQQYPIYNTTQGTKMILSYTTGIAKVFGLGGTLSLGVAKNSNDVNDNSGLTVSSPFPNPSNNQTQINYVMPDGIAEAEIVFYDMQNKEIRRYKVDNTYDNLLVSTSDISAGTYFYQLQASGHNSGAKKLIVIK